VKYDAFIFDMDGVLLDTSGSFVAAAVEAVTYATGRNSFTLDKVSLLKTIPGFNNDWYVAAAGACWIDFFPDTEFEDYLNRLNKLGGGLEALAELAPDFDAEYLERLTRLTMEAYGGTTACRKLYGFDPENIIVPGYWLTESPLVTPEQIKPLLNKAGIVTGRAKAELELGFERLGWSLPDPLVAWSDTPGLDKPNPTKLIRIVEKLGAAKPVYVGDTRDDLELVKNYRRVTGHDMDFCLVGDLTGLEGFDLYYQKVTDFLKEQV